MGPKIKTYFFAFLIFTEFNWPRFKTIKDCKLSSKQYIYKTFSDASL